MSGNFAGTGALIRLVLRRDRIRLPVWALGTIGLVGASASAVTNTYDTPAEVASYERTVGGSGASIAMSGPPTALGELPGIVIFEINGTAMVLLSLMAMFLVVRHTRTEEEAGRTELIRAAVVGRYAPIVAAVTVVTTAVVLASGVITWLLLGLGMPTTGTVLYGLSLAALGLFFTAVGVFAAQVSEHARGALGIAGAVLGAGFLIRAVGDVSESGLSWLSPLGWSQGVRPYADDRAWPLLVSLLAIAVLAVATGWLVSHRDVGAGIVAPRPGSPTGSARLGTGLGLALRLQRASIISWAGGMLVWAVAFGSLGRDMVTMLEENPELAEMIGLTGADDVVEAFFGISVLMLALIGTGFTLASVLRLRSEESAGRAEPLLATGLSRTRWALSGLAVAVLGTVGILVLIGFGVGVTHAAVTGDASLIGPVLLAALGYLPAVLVLASLGVVLFGWLPRLTLLVWAWFAGCFVVGWLGDALNLPDGVRWISPFHHVPAAPQESLTALPLAVLTTVALVAGALGLLGLRRRDIG